MSELKLLDIDSPRSSSQGEDNLAHDGDTEVVPIHLFVSPTHSGKSVAPATSGQRADHEETSFVAKGKQRAFDEISEPVGSPDGSGGYSTSGREELSPPPFPDPSSRRRNKVSDLDQFPTSSRLVFKETGSRRRSGGDSSRDADAPRSVTSMSDYLSDHPSYKDRLRDHFNSVREKALESLSRPQSRSQSRMKVLLASRPSRAEDALKREERDVAIALERHQKLRGQWRQLSQEILRKKTEKEGYEFFTQDTELDPEVSTVATPEPPEAPLSSASSGRSTDVKVTAADCLGLQDELEPVIWCPAKLAADNSEKLKEILFCPSTKKVPVEKKLEEGLQPYSLEEEGIYVGSPGTKPQRMKIRLEQRLLKTHDGKKWFGPDGELLSRAVPLEFDLEIHSSPKSELIEYQYPKLPSTNEPSLSDWDVVLDIELISVNLSHHSLFSREHVLAQRLRDIWRRYRQLRQIDNARRLKGQLEALRRTLDVDVTDQAERVFKDIRETRKRWLGELTLEKQVETKLLATWKDLQKIREEQSFRNTNIQLTVNEKEAVDPSVWKKRLAKAVEEALEDAQNEYQLEMAKYEMQREQMQQEVSQSESEEDVLPAPPQPPTPIVESAVKQEIVEKYKAAMRPAGEPEIELSLADMGPPTAASSDAREEARRNAVKQQEFFAKLLYNGKEICRSHSQPLSQMFTVKFGQRFAVRLLERPRVLSLELVESGRNPYQIFLPFPEGLATVANSDVEVLQFSSSTVITHNNAGVGCGRDVIPCPGGSSDNSKPVCLYTTGTVQCRLGWASDSSGRILAPPKSFWNTVRKHKARGELGGKLQMDVEKLREWVEQARLDPNDPDNAVFIEWLTQKEAAQPSTDNNYINELEFCDSSVIDNNLRLRLLRLRDQGEPEFRGMTMVPLSEKLIPPDIFKAYEARVARPVELEVVLDPLENRRALGRRKLDQVRQQVVQQCRLSRQHRRLADIVTEDQVPDFGTLGLTLMRWLRPKRPLRPERKQRKKVPVQSLVGQDVGIVVNVVRAFEVPVRKDVDTLSANESIEGFSLVNVRPFVSATFRGITVRTTAAEGANPTWNQDLLLPVRSSTADFSPDVLSGMRDTLYLHLFDEVVVDLVEEDGLRDTTIHQRLERHWLASLEIPVSTLYCNTRVEGTFQLYSPPVLLGYEREAHRITGAGTLPQRDATYLTLFITLQPALNPPEPFQEIFATTETSEVDRHLRGWMTEVSSLFPARKIRPFVSIAAGSSVCITRLIRPIAPPNLGVEPITASAAARFVARIPTISSAALFPGMLDVRLTCDQVMSMLCGDVEDHAVLLCCFFLHMDLPAYLLLGVGIPHGPSSYVFVNTPDGEVVWDPSSGRKYSVRDSFCPLQKVHCLVNNLNIWANIQEEESPRRTLFDVSKRAEWLPAFNKNMSPPTESIQPETLDYTETSRQAVMVLREKLERGLRDGIMRWRRRQRTQWNRYCAATMRKLLPALEEATWEASEPASPEHWQGLNDILASHKVCGFPINMAYTDMDAVMEAVKATGVHTNENEDAEFALAVYIHPYPCDVLSVWVYVASLIRRR